MPWESRLIERLRLKHYSWRTERTYREWAWRLAHYVGARGLESATDEDIKGFLSGLAVHGRVSIATQKQALNALVFLFREAGPGHCCGWGARSLCAVRFPRGRQAHQPREPTEARQ